jgi:type IV pilus assembly protein PilC
LPKYQYRAKNQAGQEIADEIEAVDSKEALARIMEQGLFPLSMKERIVRQKPEKELREPAPLSEASPMPWTGRLFGASLKQMVQFTRQFAALQDAGLPVLRSLQILQRQIPPGHFHRVVNELVEDVTLGHTLAEAFKKHPRDFDEVYVKMVEAGEAGGFLEKILNRLADAKEKTLELRRKVIRAAMYPSLVCGVAILVVIFIIVVVVPIIAGVGGNVGGALGQLLGLSRWFTHGTPPGWLMLLAFPVLLVLFRNWVNRVPAARYVRDTIKLNIPVFGRFFYKVAMIRFSRVLGSLVEAGVPILQALTSTRDTTGNEVFARTTDWLKQRVHSGVGLTQALQERPLFDVVAANMIEVGEETGDLDKLLLKIADNYQEELDAHVGYMMTVLEVGLILFMCVAVGGLIFALLSSIMGGAVTIPD